MALMEYCLVNIVLGDTPPPKPIPPIGSETGGNKMEKIYDLSFKNRRSLSSVKNV